MYNGSGEFTIDTVGNPVQYDTEIDHSWANNTLTEIADGLSTAICRDGQSTITQDIPWGGFRITNLGFPTSRLDAVNIQSIVNSSATYVTSVGGTGDAITITPSPAMTSYAAGMRYTFLAAASNTGAATINVSGLGAKDLKKQFNVALSAADIVTGQLVDIQYDGIRFVMMGPAYSEGSVTLSVGGTATYTTQVGRWTKIGRTIHIHASITINTIGTGSTSVLSGLPVAAANLGVDQALAVSDFASLATNVVWIGARVNNNAATITLRSLTAAGASAATNAVLGNSSQITLSGSYII